MTPDKTLDIAVCLALIDREINEWRYSKFLLEARHRVNTQIGNAEAAKTCAEELVKCDLALTAWAEERAKVENEKYQLY